MIYGMKGNAARWMSGVFVGGLRAFVVAILSVVLVASAWAQFEQQTWTTSLGFSFNNPMSAMISTMVMNNAREQSLAKGTGAARPNGGAVSAPVVQRRVDDGSSRFRSTGTFLKTKELADQLGSTPEQRAQYQQLMEAIQQEIDKKATAAGKANDLALALSFFFGENARIYHGLPEVPDQEYLDLRETMAMALSGNSALKNAPDRQKQEMYETLIAYAGLTVFGYEQSVKAGNPEYVKGYRKVAGQNLLAVAKMSPDEIQFVGGVLRVGK